jgi:hypothetical protein
LRGTFDATGVGRMMMMMMMMMMISPFGQLGLWVPSSGV